MPGSFEVTQSRKVLVLASSNSGKFVELQQILGDSPYELRMQSEFGLDALPENGSSFVENALFKARHASAKTGLAAVADDSGLVVPALAGGPGLRSARYAGATADDAENLAKLVAEIGKLVIKRPAAFFYCAAVYVQSARDVTPLISCATWEGNLVERPSGRNGFGYDPVFFLPEHGCTAAEMAPEVKSLCSHRAQAFRLLARILPTT